jgi:hypothetical protein
VAIPNESNKIRIMLVCARNCEWILGVVGIRGNDWWKRYYLIGDGDGRIRGLGRSTLDGDESDRPCVRDWSLGDGEVG